MKPRRPGRAARKDRLSWQAQHWRLQEIAAGRLQPHFEREHLFLWTLEARGKANLHDFIVPGLLFLAERLNQPFAPADDAAPRTARPSPVVRPAPTA